LKKKDKTYICQDCHKELPIKRRGRRNKRCPSCREKFRMVDQKIRSQKRREIKNAKREIEYNEKFPGNNWSGALPEPRFCDHCKKLFQPKSPHQALAMWCTKEACRKVRELKFGGTGNGKARPPYKFIGIKSIPMKDRKPCQGEAIFQGQSTLWQQSRCKKKIDNNNRYFCSYCQEVAATIENCI